MSPSNRRNPLTQYGQVAVGSELAYASPHRLVQMLMEGALDKIAIAKGSIQRGDLEEKSRHVSWAVSIIKGLWNSLDYDNGGGIAENLGDLYDYMVRRLLEANSQNDPTLLDEVAGLLGEVKSAWDALPEDVKRPPSVPKESVG